MDRFWFHAQNFLLMAMGASVVFTATYLLVRWGGDRRVFGDLFANVPILGHQYKSVATYTMAFTWLVFFVFTWLGAFLSNLGYVREGLASGGNLWFPQLMIWCAAPLTFTILNVFMPERHSPLDTRSIISLLLVFAAALVRYWK